jgi:NAD(P)-dependent dehydrogenase (short-subunit alcohol dehydrogenase family)
MRTVVITGGGGGLGRVIATRFLESLDRVYVCDVDERAVLELRQAGKVARADVVDVSDCRQVEQYFATVRRVAERVDVLINNVGVAGPRAALEDIEPDEWSKTLDANLNAAYWASRQVLPAMRRDRSGCIVNVSTASVRTLPACRSAYIVSKAALESLTMAVAREAGAYNVRCNAVRPGVMDNERMKRVLARVADQRGMTVEAVESEQLQFISMRTKVSMEEVAEMVHFLASEAASHVTGQIISVDGDMQWEA